MRKLFYISLLLASGHFPASAQLTDGSTAPDFTFQDVNGVSHNLYSYLNQGKIVALDISATWCVPCWDYHNRKTFDSLYNLYDTPGSQTWKTLFIEADPNTNMADLQGTGPNTEGDWITGVNYPVIAPAAGVALTEFRDNYALGYFPTFYLICPNKKVYEVKVSPPVAKWTASAGNCSAAGLDNLEDADPISVYPNPAEAQVGFYFSLSRSASVTMRIKNMNGQLLKHIPYGQLPAGDHTIRYNASRLPPGMYFISFVIDNGRTITKKLVVR